MPRRGVRRRRRTIVERLAESWLFRRGRPRTIAAATLATITVASFGSAVALERQADVGGQTDNPAANATPTESLSSELKDSEVSNTGDERDVREISKVFNGLSLDHILTPAEWIVRMGKKKFELFDKNDTDSMNFNVASFNMLGARHTGGSGGWASGAARVGPALAKFRGHGLSVVGMQESQAPQIAAIINQTGGSWGVYPGTSLGMHYETHNSITWNKSVWTLVEAHTSLVPYFHGERIPMPNILLRHNESGQEVWFGNYHNPADSRGPAGRWRSQAIAIEAAVVRERTADGTPMIVTGDFNDRAAFACPFTSSSGMHSADGAYTENGQCHLPDPMYVDWVLGSPDVEFSGFVGDQSTVSQKISDHPLIKATAEVPIARDTSDCKKRLSTKGTLMFCPEG